MYMYIYPSPPPPNIVVSTRNPNLVLLYSSSMGTQLRTQVCMVLEDVVAVCVCVGNMVSPVVCNSSPEGFMLPSNHTLVGEDLVSIKCTPKNSCFTFTICVCVTLYYMYNDIYNVPVCTCTCVCHVFGRRGTVVEGVRVMPSRCWVCCWRSMKETIQLLSVVIDMARDNPDMVLVKMEVRSYMYMYTCIVHIIDMLFSVHVQVQ